MRRGIVIRQESCPEISVKRVCRFGPERPPARCSQTAADDDEVVRVVHALVCVHRGRGRPRPARRGARATWRRALQASPRKRAMRLRTAAGRLPTRYATLPEPPVRGSETNSRVTLTGACRFTSIASIQPASSMSSNLPCKPVTPPSSRECQRLPRADARSVTLITVAVSDVLASGAADLPTSTNRAAPRSDKEVS